MAAAAGGAVPFAGDEPQRAYPCGSGNKPQALPGAA